MEKRMEISLIRRAQAGDQEAFGELIELYAGLVSRVSQVLVPDRFLAQDAVQEAWLDVWRNLSRFRVNEPFRPWLLTIVANRCRKIMRRIKPNTVSLDTKFVQELQTNTDLEAVVIEAVSIEEVKLAVAQLRVEQQHVLALRYFAELELEEIAQLTNIPLGTVKSRIHRALNTIRNELQKKYRLESYLEQANKE
jgi:RNA polymerase sigma-70 factor, ECF subfamily